MDVKVSHLSKWVDWDEIKLLWKKKQRGWRNKKKDTNWIKTGWKLQSFLEMDLFKRKYFVHINSKTMGMNIKNNFELKEEKKVRRVWIKKRFNRKIWILVKLCFRELDNSKLCGWQYFGNIVMPMSCKAIKISEISCYLIGHQSLM